MEDSNFLRLLQLLVLIQSQCCPCITSNTCFDKVGKKEKKIFLFESPLLGQYFLGSYVKLDVSLVLGEHRPLPSHDGNWPDLLNTCTLSAQLIKAKLPFMLSLSTRGN